jgi:GNAT superfamily N-acetyltransferase
MARLIRLDDAAPDVLPPDFARLLPATAEEIARSAPDARWAVLAADGTASACCSLWWTAVPSHADERLGVLGHFAARDPDSAAMLLRHALAELSAQTCTLAVGPMDGNTWRRYRFVTERGTEPAFFLEPDNPDEYRRYWTDVGFAPLAGYSSTRVDRLDTDHARLEELTRRATDHGIRIRPIDPTRLEAELRWVYRVAEISFRKNFLYTPITEDEFVEQYAKVGPVLNPALVQIAEDDEGPVGFSFAIPDVNQAKRGERVDTAIMKTLAVLPGRRSAGLGGLLLFRSYQAAREEGFSRAIHALMHDANVSRNLNREHTRTLRRYTLYSRRLA